jgi:hypothetical protein
MESKSNLEKPVENLMDGLFKEMNRCRELSKAYEEIGSAGIFGLAMILRDIDAAEQAIKENDVIKMLQAYKSLKECQ